MENQIKKFLEFNGKNVYFKAIDGKWWIAIKPICDALAVNYNRQFQNLKEDKIIGQLFAIQQMVGADGRIRKMVCLSEFFIYGWIFQLQSDSDDLKEYKWKCYELLYNYFHGATTERNSSLKEKTQLDIEIEKVEEELKTDPLALKLQELKEKKKVVNKSLRQLDKNIIDSQLELWDINVTP